MATPPLAPSNSEPLTPQQELRDSAEFERLRRIFRSFVFPMTVLFLVWYFLYVLLAAYAPDFMATKVVGNINVGLIFGLAASSCPPSRSRSPTSTGPTRSYDPAAEAIRDDLEAGAR